MACESHTHRGLTYGRTLKCNMHHPRSGFKAGDTSCAQCGMLLTIERDGNTAKIIERKGIA